MAKRFIPHRGDRMTGRGVFTRRRRQALCLAMAVVFIGCAREPDPFQRYVPASDLARSAIDAALSDWQAGKAPGLIDRLAVKVHVSDSQRKARRRLEEFEILGEVPATTVRCFAVRLRFSNPEGEEKARYVVFGIDPLWVYRQEDYDMLSHWEHPMPSEENAEDESEEAGKVLSKEDDRERQESTAESPAEEDPAPGVAAGEERTAPALPTQEESPRE